MEKMRWDVYRCEGGHIIIVEHKKTWPDEYVQEFFLCDICNKMAVYEGSTDTLREVEENEGQGEDKS